MIYEVKVQYERVEEDGNSQTHKEYYVIDGCDTFTEAEEKALVAFACDNINDLDVTEIKRSKVREIANSGEGGVDKMFLAEVKDVFVKDDGTEKDIKYKILFFAKNFDDAKIFISEYIRQGYNMLLVCLKETKFIDVL